MSRSASRRLNVERCEDRRLLAVNVFNDAASFRAALPNAEKIDFETASGLPAANSGLQTIGDFRGVEFDAAVARTGAIRNTSGVQVMTATDGFDDTAVLEFNQPASRPTGIGFYALDLEVGESVRVAVEFANGQDRIFDVTLGNRPAGTPVFFGVVDTSDKIVDVAIFSQTQGAIASPLRPWAIDDLWLNNLQKAPGNDPNPPVNRPNDAPDVAEISNNEIRLLSNQGDHFELTARVNVSMWHDVQVDDFNGDGFDDLLGRTNSGQWQFVDSTHATVATWGTWNGSVQWRDVSTGDVDNDGRPDLIGRTPGNQWWVAHNKGTHFENVLFTTWSAKRTWHDIQFADFTGDGRVDIAGRTDGQWWVAESSGTFATNRFWGRWSTQTTWSDAGVGQFAGSASADIVGRSADGTWWVARNDGGRFVNVRLGAWSPNQSWHDVLFGDFDNNGLDDIAGRTGGGQWWRSNNVSATLQTQHWGSWSANIQWSDVMVRDVTGDGLTDLIGRSGSGAWWVSENRGNESLRNKAWYSSSNHNYRMALDGLFAI